MPSPSLIVVTSEKSGAWHWMVFAFSDTGPERRGSFLHEGRVGSRAEALAHAADVLEMHAIPMTSTQVVTLHAPR